MSVLLWSLVAVASTLAGGLLALRFRHRLAPLLALTAVTLFAVVCFDLVPESLELARSTGGSAIAPLAAMAAGFVLFHVCESLARPGLLPAAALVGHSFLDGMGIGLAFQLSPAFGVTVACTVVAHDFLDGLNTVGVMLVHRNSNRRTIAMLAADAVAPLAGAAVTLAWRLPAEAMAGYLGFFGGVLLSIALAHARRAMPAFRNPAACARNSQRAP